MTPRVRDYLEQEAKAAGLTVDDLLSRNKRHDIAYARRRVAVRLRGDGFSFPQIGRWLGLHPSTVVYYMNGKARPKRMAA